MLPHTLGSSRRHSTMLVVLLVALLTSSVSGANPPLSGATNTPTDTTIVTSAATTTALTTTQLLDVATRQTLCSNQLGMCTVSCQSQVQQNTCNVETLEWSCICKPSATRSFKSWQFPVPFQLCRSHLVSCLESCQNTEQEQKPQLLRLVQRNVDERIANDDTVGGDDEEEEDEDEREGISPSQGQPASVLGMDLESPDEVQLWRHVSKDRAAAVSRMAKHRQHTNLHQDAISEASSNVMDEQSGNRSESGGNAGQTNGSDIRNAGHDQSKTPPLTSALALDDPSVARGPKCVAQCRAGYACGTSLAPQYRDLTGFLQDMKMKAGDRAEGQSRDNKPKAIKNGAQGVVREMVLMIAGCALSIVLSIALF